MRNILLSLLALSTAIGTGFTSAMEPLHGSAAAPTVVQRVMERRQERRMERHSSSRSFVPQRRSTSASSSSLRPRTVPESARLLQSRQNRLMMRTGNNRDAELKQKLLDAVNMERALQAHPALRMNAKLSASAQLHADDMIVRNYFDHADPEGLRVGNRARAAGYGDINAQTCNCSYKISIGEDLAKGQTTVEQVIREWMASPTHREAILSDDYNDIGIGIAGDVWVLNFGGVEVTNGTGGMTH